MMVPVSGTASKTILILANDVAPSAGYARELSAQPGTCCVQANNVSDAVFLWHEQAPDCIVVEDRPGGLSAGEFLGWIADADGQLPCPVIVIAVIPEDGAATGFLRRGAQDYLALDDSLPACLPRAVHNAIQRFASIRDSARARVGEVFADAAIGLIIRDLAEPGLRANRAFCDMTGWTQQELVSMSIDEITHPDDRTAIEQIRRSNQDSAVYEKRYLRRDGSCIWARTSVSRVRDDQGNLRKILAVVENISERKQAEQALRENAERFRQLVQSIHQVFWFYSIDPFRCLYVSPAFETIWGIPAHRVYDNPTAWLECVHPDDRPRVETEFQSWLHQDSKQVLAGEFRIVRGNGSVRWLSYQGSSVTTGADGDSHVSGVTEDITERKTAEESVRESEERLKLAHQAAGLACWEWDMRANRGIFSDEYLSLCGRSRDQMCKSREEWLQWVHPDDHHRAFKDIEAALQGDRIATEFRIIRPHGDVRWLAGWGHMKFDSRGVPLRMVGVSIDITERKLVELELRRSQARLERLTNSNIVGVAMAAADGRVTEANDAFLRMIGYDQQDLAEGRINWRAITPSEWEGPDRSAIEQIRATGSVGPHEKEFFRKDGSRVPVLIGAAAMSDQRHALTLVHDLTEQKRMTRALERSEARSRALTEHSSEQITLLDADGNRIYASPSVLPLLGYEPEEYLNFGPFELLHPEELPAAMAAFREIVSCPGKSATAEQRLRRKDGSWIWAECVATNLLSEPGVEAVVVNWRDITERKRMIQALEQSERRFRALTERSSEQIALISESGRTLYLSPSTVNFAGFMPDERLGRDAFENVHSDDLERTKSVFREVVSRPGGSSKIELRVRRKDGRWIWSESVLTNLLNEPGVEAVVVNSRDITERKQATEALTQSERRFRALIENSSEHISLFDKNGKRTYTSPSTFRMVGYAAEELKSIGPFGLIHPDDIARSRSIFDKVMARPGSTATVEVRIERKDGAWIWIESVLTNLLSEPGIESLVINAHEITERKMAAQWVVQANERLNALIHAAPVAICELDAQGHLTRWNPAASKMFGWRDAEVLGKMPPYIPEDFMGHYLLLQAGWNNGQHLEGIEITGVRKDGAPIEISLWTSPIHDALGKVSGVVSIAVDITERRQLEQKLQESEKMRVIGRLAGGVAHDFNNLLTVILGYAKLLREKLPQDHQLQKHAGAIHEAGDRAAALVEQLLTFSRQKVLQPRILDLNTVVERSTRMLKRLIGDDIRLDMQLVNGGAPVRVDPSQLDQVIFNLVVNARDAMPGGGSIRIETSVQYVGAAEAAQLSLRPGQHAVLAVTDTGHGMDDAVKARIFEPFFTTKEPGQGTGLGLSTVYGIVQQSGGCVRVQSKPSAGATFAVYLPSAEKAADLGDSTELVFEKGTEYRPRLGTVLLVEDEPSLRELVHNALVQTGYAVIEAADGQQALQAVQDRLASVDLLLTDVVMPGMRGPELAQQLRGKRPGLPVIYISGFRDQERPGQVEPGAVFVQKPFSLGALLDKVEELIPIPASIRNSA